MEATRKKYGIKFRALVIPLNGGHRISERAFYAYRCAASAIQVKRFLSIVYPYPQYVIPDMPVPVNSGGQRTPF